MDNNSKQCGKSPLYGIVDERTRVIVYQGDAYAGRFVMFAVLFDVFLRGLDLNLPFIASNWDLLLIVILGGFASTAYQIKSRVISGRPFARSIFFLLLLVGAAAVVAALVHFLIPR